MATTTGTLDISAFATRISDKVQEALEEAVHHTVNVGEASAKRLAPVRKVSDTSGWKTLRRRMTLREAQDIPVASIRDSLVKDIEAGRKIRTVYRRGEQRMPTPELDFDVVADQVFGLKNKRHEQYLNPGGRSELRKARSSRITMADPYERKAQGVKLSSAAYVFDPGGSRSKLRATLGGRLRGEIFTEVFAEDAVVDGWIVSPTEYARYVEFPTSRTAAQPYMRPTLKYLRRILRLAGMRSLRRVFGGKAA